MEGYAKKKKGIWYFNVYWFSDVIFKNRKQLKGCQSCFCVCFYQSIWGGMSQNSA